MGILTKAAVLRRMAESSADPDLRREALKKARSVELSVEDMKTARDNLAKVLQFLAGLPDGKSAPSAASIGEVLDLDAKDVQYSLDWLRKDGRLNSDGVLDARTALRLRGVTTGPSLGRSPETVAALGQTRASNAGATGKVQVTKLADGRIIRSNPVEGIAELKQQVRNLRATITKLQNQ